MKIEINIPKEFERHFNQDKFENSLERISAGIKQSLENGNYVYETKYEYETIKMLEEVLKNSKSAYSVDKVIEELEEFLINYGVPEKSNVHQRIIEIVKQGGVSEDMCEYRRQLEGYYNSLFITSCCHIYRVGNNFKFCPHCGKKIKVIQNDN